MTCVCSAVCVFCDSRRTATSFPFPLVTINPKNDISINGLREEKFDETRKENDKHAGAVGVGSGEFCYYFEFENSDDESFEKRRHSVI